MKPTMNSKRGEKLQVLFGAFLVVTLSVSRSFGQDDRSVAVRPGFALRKTLPAAGISDPRLNLREELQWSVSYAGSAAARSILSANQARPLSLAAADLNEDGVPDLLSGYAGGNGGVLALHLGNADSIYPNTPEAMRRKQAFSWSAGAQASAGNYAPAPFVSPARAFDLPGTPDFLGAGDFDADGHWDVVAAARGGFEIVVLHGNGQGDFGEPRSIKVAGAVTALVTGEMNRRDGLTDVVVGISGNIGNSVLIFEGPNGALSRPPETIALSDEPVALALGQLDDDYPMDLAVATRSDLLIIHGRDRKLSLEESVQAEVPDAITTRYALSFAPVSIAIGDFAGGNESEIALLAGDGSVHLFQRAAGKTEFRQEQEPAAYLAAASPAGLIGIRVSGLPKEDLLVVDRASRQMHLLMTDAGERGNAIFAATAGRRNAALSLDSEPMAVLPMRLNADAVSDLGFLRSGQSAPLAIGSAAAATFVVTSTLDTGPGSLREAVTSANANAGADSITFAIPGGGPYTISLSNAIGITDAVTIDGTTQPGFTGNPIIELSCGGAIMTGLIIAGGPSTVRGLVISDCGQASVLIQTSSNVVEGNFLGTDPTGTVQKSTAYGIASGATSGNTFGGTTAAARNVIAFGVIINAAPAGGSTTNIVQGNYIGVDATGNARFGTSTGIVVICAANNTIGGTLAGARNITLGSASSSSGVELSGSSSCSGGVGGNLIQGNFIGTNASGTAALGNGLHGVYLVAANNTVGGTAATARNVISASAGNGVVVGDVGNVVQGNYIGTNAAGTAALGNAENGVIATMPMSNTSIAIGGASAGAGNVISGNGMYGVRVGAHQAQVQGNLIGANAAGSAALGNSLGGVLAEGDATFLIGGSTAAARNVISGNNGDGLRIANNVDIAGIQVYGNYIGTDTTGASAIPNTGSGVRVTGPGNFIGGTTSGQGNTIAFNGGAGVAVVTNLVNAWMNAILGNSIFSNNGLGIDLGSDGVTPNDPGDFDLGPNGMQNFPVLTSATTNGSSTTIQGTLNSAASLGFRIEFFSNQSCDPSGFGEGRVFLGSTNVTTDGTGNVSFTTTLTIGVAAGAWITSTATDASNNTSEFSGCIQVPPAPPTVDYGILTLRAGSTLRNPAVGRTVNDTYSVVVDNHGTMPGPANVSLAVTPLHTGCPSVVSMVPAGPVPVNLNPGRRTTVRFDVTYARCTDPSPSADYSITATVTAAGDTHTADNSQSATLNIR